MHCHQHIWHSPSNAHAYRLLIVKELRLPPCGLGGADLLVISEALNYDIGFGACQHPRENIFRAQHPVMPGTRGCLARCTRGCRAQPLSPPSTDRTPLRDNPRRTLH
ncbi:hypothetical protein RA210_U240049 [Rubrivivax sp. A210]|nr:hypothetical protein RA210_U240049 [Rubrivivax sp. A210]